ncbi:hypothetical protein TM239_08770 [Bradyrhizobium sp. TM239]|nr:hypothetical protein TM239_08770 [Bradyrhizobium sp. TM239]
MAPGGAAVIPCGAAPPGLAKLSTGLRSSAAALSEANSAPTDLPLDLDIMIRTNSFGLSDSGSPKATLGPAVAHPQTYN